MCTHSLKFAEIDAKLSEIQSILQKLVDGPVSDELLTSTQIMAIMKISREAFQKKLPEFVDAGMFKAGQWRMRRSALEKYLQKLENVL